MNWTEVTSWLVPISVLLIVLIAFTYDLFAWRKGGVDATISVYVIRLAKQYPIVAAATGLLVGILIGHFFWQLGPV